MRRQVRRVPAASSSPHVADSSTSPLLARIIDAHGGQLQIKSRAGVGTVMHVFLPIAGESAKQFVTSEPVLDEPNR